MIGIIAAMNEELNELLHLMNDVEEIVYFKTIVYKGKLANKEVVAILSGIGKVAASIACTCLIEHYQVEGIINIGTAGAIDERLKTLDVVISDVIAQHDFEIPGWNKGYYQNKRCFQASLDYLNRFKNSIQEDETVYIGHLASGDAFIHLKKQVEKIQKEYPNTLAVEMEAGAISQVCDFYDVPFVIVRCISDHTLHPKNELTFEEYLHQAAKKSARWCYKFVETL